MQGSATQAQLMASVNGILGGDFDSREVLKVPVVIKTDVGGTLEAIQSSLLEIKSEDEKQRCIVDVVYGGVGDVTTSGDDYNLQSSATK